MGIAPTNFEDDLKEINSQLEELTLNKNESLKSEENEVKGEQEEGEEDNYKKAAIKIKEANALLFLSGAGFSADSGLLVYKDIANEYKDEGYDYSDLCTPVWLEEDPDLFYGFWGSCFNEYRAKAPHLGYEIIKCWRDKYFSGNVSHCNPHHSNFFAVTSNVDAHLKKAGFSNDEIYEIHGNSEEWQCSDGICAERHKLENISLPEEYEFKIKQRRAYDLRKSEDQNNNLDVNENKNHNNRPLCLFCGKALRPKILMFNDAHYIFNMKQEDNFDQWQESIEQHYRKGGITKKNSQEEKENGGKRQEQKDQKKTSVVVLEIGAGLRVPSIRMEASETSRRFNSTFDETTMIRIGFESLEKYLCTSINDNILIKDGALTALKKIDNAMKIIHEKQNDNFQ
eukprot:Awhi_evm1s5460